MERFKDYLELKLSRESFYRQYHGNCAICPITVEIVRCIDQSELPLAEIARKCGVDESVIENLKEADHCCVDSVRTLSVFFGIAPPDDCLKDKVVPAALKPAL